MLVMYVALNAVAPVLGTCIACIVVITSNTPYPRVCVYACVHTVIIGNWSIIL